MKTTKAHDERIAKMTFSSVYPHYVAKIEKKGRTVEELHEVISWLTGFNAEELQRHIEGSATFAEFFAEATLNPNASLITGSICGYRVEEIETPLTQQARYLDKLVDELLCHCLLPGVVPVIRVHQDIGAQEERAGHRDLRASTRYVYRKQFHAVTAET